MGREGRVSLPATKEQRGVSEASRPRSSVETVHASLGWGGAPLLARLNGTTPVGGAASFFTSSLNGAKATAFRDNGYGERLRRSVCSRAPYRVPDSYTPCVPA